MKSIIDFLSGNVPGGITIYIFVLSVIFFVLFYLYRNSELFTGLHFKWWFLGSWVLITLIYAYLWVSNPSPILLKRYSVFITAEEPQDKWLANFYRDEISETIQPFKDRDTYFFPQKWSYLAKVDLNNQKLQDICRKVVIHQLVWGKIDREGDKISLELSLKKLPADETIETHNIKIDSGKPQNVLPEFIQWIETFLPIDENYQFNGIADKSFVEAKDEFLRGNYRESNQLITKVLKSYPDNEVVKKWHYYNLIKLAGMQRPDKELNPFEKKKMPWQVTLSEARNFLKKLVRENLEKGITDDFLNNMLAESYIWEENFHEAEVFLKNAFAENPFNVYVLENLSYLHSSRYEELGFDDQYEIYERIVNLCPIYSKVLIKYVEKLLRITPVHGIASNKAKELIENFLSINPNSATSWLLLGQYYHASLNREKAFQAFSKADSLEPNNTIVQYNLGVMYYLEDAYDDAERHFKKAIELDDHLDSHLYLGSIYFKEGEYEKALEHFRYRVAHKTGEDDKYAKEAMKGIRQCLEALNIPIPGEAS